VSEKPAWTLRRDDDGVAWLTMDKPDTSANTLSKAVVEELDGLLNDLAARPPRALIVISAKASGFIAGADIREFTAMRDEHEAYEMARRGQRVFARIAALPCPSVAALHGFALGGGLELALFCRYRVAVGDERLSLGLPEVMLGVQPGFGGTIHTVQLIGVRAAMQLMLTGKPLRADQALRVGMVDRLVASRDELPAAARVLALDPPPPHRPPLLDRLLCWPLIRPFLKRTLTRQVAARLRRDHYPAPYSMIDIWAGNGARGQRAYEDEARGLARLMLSPSGKGLIRVFLLQDRLKALGKKTARPLDKVHVIGAGVMGGDIAAWCALRGLQVTLQDRELKYIEPALTRAGELFRKRLKTDALRQAASARLRADVGGDGAGSADVVIEAIFENLDAKQQLFKTVEARAPAHALLATNTSSITLEAIAAALPQPSRLTGLHFFNPVPAMPLVEVIRGKDTDPAHVVAALAFARRLDKLPLPCRSGPGFLVNRVLFPYLHEAFYLASEGVPLELIDHAAVEFGMPMGPIELADVVGLDVVLHVGEIITRDLKRESPPLVESVRTLVGAGKLGRKSGQGLYAWVEGKVQKTAITGVAPADCGDRLMLPMVNECVACLREGIVEDVDLVDAGVLFGTGFAPFRGGPLFYARQRGIDSVVAALRALAVRHGSRFAPDDGWAALANWRT
jgi:3-hydroxyacyl-CoA dehydrogenase / enoyl-CoA hydratase / 3-hydroxybutyryl-CoA epimerase